MSEDYKIIYSRKTSVSGDEYIQVDHHNVHLGGILWTSHISKAREPEKFDKLVELMK